MIAEICFPRVGLPMSLIVPWFGLRKSRKQKATNSKKRRGGSSVQLQLEPLEGRLVPTTVTFDGGGSDDNWSTAENWSGDTLPGTGDTAEISSGTVILDTNVTVAGLTFSGGTITGPETGSYTLTVTDEMTWTAGSMHGAGELQI